MRVAKGLANSSKVGVGVRSLDKISGAATMCWKVKMAMCWDSNVLDKRLRALFGSKVLSRVDNWTSIEQGGGLDLR